ncbi:MAG: transposase [Acidobacteriota bacterium]
MEPESFVRIAWHHAPEHRFIPGADYFVTASTLDRRHFFFDSLRLRLLQDTFLEIASRASWHPLAWVFFSEHYHWIARSPVEEGLDLSNFLQRFHAEAARRLNRLDRTPGRRVFFQYWDRCLTYESSYYAQINYIHQNPVRHGLVSTPKDHPFSSARLYELNLPSPLRRRLASYGVEKVREPDGFNPVWRP